MFIIIDYRLLLLSITIHGINGNHRKPSNQISHKWAQVSKVKAPIFSRIEPKWHFGDRLFTNP